MLKWFSRRERSSSVCKESMLSFLKKSSLGDSEPGARLKCSSARARTSWVVFSSVGMTRINLAFSSREEKSDGKSTVSNRKQGGGEPPHSKTAADQGW